MSTASGAGAAAGTLGASRSGPLGGSGAAMGGAGGPATGTVGRTGTLHLSSTVAPKVATAAKTMVRGGTVVATPFATSATPFVRTYPSSIAFGLHDTVLNPPNRERASHARSTHSKKAVTVQSAGTVHKVSVPYSTNAGRNRVRNDPKRIPPPFKSTLSFDMGPFNRSRHPYRTLASAAMAPSEIPMHERLGFANPAVAEDIAKRLHKRVLDA